MNRFVNTKDKFMKKNLFGFLIFFLVILAMPTNAAIPAGNSAIVWSYPISKMPIAGVIYHAKMLDNGNIIYAVGRGIYTGSHNGVAEINPTTGQTVFSWHNDSWGSPENGPESIYKYSNGNYLICDTDGGDFCYEMYPNHSLAWNYNAGRGALARPMVINGEDDVILLVVNTITIIKRSNQRIVWTDSNFTYVDDADYMSINGIPKLVVSDYQDHTIKLIDYNTHKVEWRYSINAAEGPYEVDFYDSNSFIVAMGTPTNEIAIIRRSSSPPDKIIWYSPKFSNTPIAEKLINNSYVMTADGQFLEVIRIK